MSGLGKLRVEVIEARNLEAKDSNGLSDPYCYLWIAPNDSKSRLKTKIMFKTLDPVWNETFEFDVDVTDPNSELQIHVNDYDMLSADDFMGYCAMPIYKLVNKGVVDGWYTLLPREGKKDVVKGDIHLRMTLSDASEQGDSSLQSARAVEVRFADIVPAEVLSDLSSQERKRQEIMFEFINTEEQYVADVSVIIQSFLHPICERKLLTHEESSMLFSNIKAILPVNMALCHALKERQESNPIKLIRCLADVFLAHVDSLHVYAEYCSNQPQTTELTEEFRAKYPEFAAFLDESRPECRNLGLQAFLVKPFQRLCKYPLLLRELDRATPDDHPDKKNIELACVKIKEVVDAANERTRQVEDLRKIQQIKKLLGEELCSQYVHHGREVILGCPALVLPKGRNTPQQRFLVLLSDMILVLKGGSSSGASPASVSSASISRSSSKSKSSLSRSKSTAVHLSDEIFLRAAQLLAVDQVNPPESAELSHVIEVKLPPNSWRLFFSGAEEKDKWWSKLQNIQDVLLYQAACARGQRLAARNLALESEAALRKDDQLVAKLLEEIHALRGIAASAESAAAQYREQVAQLEKKLHSKRSHHNK